MDGWIRFKDLVRFQAEHKLWLDHNFPFQKPWQPLLGLQEELGELCHAYLKATQGIRGHDYDGEKTVHDIEDAIGDIIIYLASFCNSAGFDIAHCLEKAWNEVKERDWQANPTTGADVTSPENAG